MLRDPDCARFKIGEIAARAGFSDISHFNRSFRLAFGDTPYGVRVRAARAQHARRLC
jgi:AraC-like DNA-binding protein